MRRRVDRRGPEGVSRNDMNSFLRVSVSPRHFVSLPDLYRAPVVLRELEDRRTFHPSRALRPAGSFMRDDRRIIAKSSAVNVLRDDISARVGFAVPTKVAVCVRRQQRKEVLHASRFFGKGAGGVSRNRRRNEWSGIDC